ncbi:MAG: Sec-independent protein translocase protein TatB [Gammaproteobacteria bacterium]|nr:Sec-independent protein translocase protein TatB [Gammaproteobacteria bacterium]
MFDIGFWEILLIGIVALLVVGPDQFPSLVRNVMEWVRKGRQMVQSAKDSVNEELERVDSLKNSMAKEADLAELHRLIDETRVSVSSNIKQVERSVSEEQVK